MKYILAAVALLIRVWAWADITTDKAMATIGRDTKTYISADVRAASEKEAYDEAIKRLCAQITDYFKNESNGEEMPDASYISNLSSNYKHMTSKIADNRYRVMLYVKKSDLMRMNNSSNTMLFSKGESKDSNSETYAQEPTEAMVTLTPMNPTLSQLLVISTREQLTNSLQTLRKSGGISGAAAFPIGKANDFYVAVIDGDKVLKIIRFSDGKYIDITSDTIVDMSNFSNCTGYWFTL